MPTIDTPHGSVDYRAAGPEDSAFPPVVFVHGLLVNAELWTGTADALAERGIRSYAPDLPLGSHRTPLRPDADLSPRGIAGLIVEFLAALDLDDVTLVGNDTGGALCQFVLDTDAARVGRLVLTNCDAFEKFPPAPFNLIVALGRRPAGVRLLANGVRPTVLRHSPLGFGGLARERLDPELTRRWITPVLENADIRRDLSRFLREVRPADLVDVGSRLDRFTKPVRLIWGDADPFFKPAFGRRLRDAFADATLVEVPGGKTFLALDSPQLLADEITAAFYPTAASTKG